MNEDRKEESRNNERRPQLKKGRREEGVANRMGEEKLEGGDIFIHILYIYIYMIILEEHPKYI